VVSELRDVRDFLIRHAPFSALPTETLDDLPRGLTVRYLRRGATFPPDGGEAAALYVLRKGAVELRDGRGELVEKLAEGEHFGGGAEAETGTQPLGGVAVEDTLVYVLPAALVARLREEHADFDASFEASIARRLQQARDAIDDAPGVGGNLLRLNVRQLIARPPVSADQDISIQDAARRMTEERVSSLLLVHDGALLGIVTDRDLRTRSIAQGLDPSEPIGRIMTPRPHTVSPDASAFEALMSMSRLRIHHLPVVDREGLHGIISTHDVLRSQTSNPLYLADRIRRCSDVEELRAVVAETRELQVQLVAARASAQQLGQALTSVCDSVTRRLIELATARLGDPPVPFAWIATGSQGRGELTLRSDQDNSMILDDAFDAGRDGSYYEELARSVNEGLDSCGYASCPGDVMASNPRWRQPLGGWRDDFAAWVGRTDHKAATLAANFFDMRTVWGADDLRHRLMEGVLQRCRGEKVFLAYMAGHALGNQPPIGFFRQFVLVRSGQHEGEVDLKRHGLLPIVDLARYYALASGIEAVGTLQRLADARVAGGLSEDGAENLAAAFEFISDIRARHQAEYLRRNEPVDNFIAPDALTAAERRHLKDAFAAIATLQDAVRAAHGDRLPL
jgi:CBS domain-containing protein